jgi:hypothetical protein
MTAFPTPHLEKLKATFGNTKLPSSDRNRLQDALNRYTQWVSDLLTVPASDVSTIVHRMVALLNSYRNYLDVEVIFNSQNDFLYRQKGQIKLDNSVIEEFLPHLVHKCVLQEMQDQSIELGPRKAFSAIYFASTLDRPGTAGDFRVRTKDQDFTVARRLFLRTSYDANFSEAETKDCYLAYVAAECKTNLDKTMFQEAVATAHDVKSALVGARYFLLCEWLDMTPQSISATDIDDVLILRKAKRISSSIRKSFSAAADRHRDRQVFVDFLNAHPFAADVFERFVSHVAALLSVTDPAEQDVLDRGYF